ncbi:MAG: diadenylate cyclase CdaA [Bacteroidota bacterium]|jgi:diadenylate cyclase|nr:diadenylate cyclase CdaA [Bacteroidota bacterium]
MLFNIGFLEIGWTDILDIVVVTFIFYRLYLVMRGTIAIQIFLGLIVVVAGSFVAASLELKAMTWILRTLADVWVVAFIILFQPELRRLLVILGRGRLMANLMRRSMDETIEAIAEACEEMAQRQIGALIVIPRRTGIRMIIESGIPLGAVVSKQLLLSVFNPKAPLHDGAVVIKDRIVEAARCTLPLSNQLRIDGFIMGMRHRSAVGISEQTDALAIVVSEETGTISVAEDGRLQRDLSAETLRAALRHGLNVNVKSIFDALSGQENGSEDRAE